MWNQTYGGVGDEVAYSLVKTSDESFALAGEQDKKLWLIKTDSNGAIQWNQTYGQAKYNQACLAVEAPDGGFVLASDNFQFIKTDSLGAVEWNHTHGREDIDTVYALTKTIDGGFALVGETTSDDSGNGFWLIKTDSNGNIQWNQIYSRTEYDRPYTLIQTSDGGYALAGDTIYNSSTCIWVIKTDETGVIPEFPALLVLPLFLVITTIIVFYKKLMPKKSNCQTCYYTNSSSMLKTAFFLKNHEQQELFLSAQKSFLVFLELERNRIHTITLTRRFRTIIKHMPKVTSTLFTDYFGSLHSMAVIRF